MKKKILSFILATLLVVSCAFLLTACFGEDADPTLYHLTLSSNLDKVEQADLKATYAYGCKGVTVSEGVRDDYDIECLKKAGATDEDIAKAGKRQDDGSYYFFDQDPMYIEAPEMEGYIFKGFYYKGTDNLAYRPIISMVDGEKGLLRWNMDNKDVELEARYEVLEYTITYVDMNGEIANPTNPTTYNAVEDPEVTLADGAKLKGYDFDYWYYEKINSDSQKERVKCTKLPSFYDENVIGNGVNGYFLTVFAEYTVEKHSVTINFDENIVDYSVKIEGTDEEADLSEKFEYGTKLDIYVDVSYFTGGIGYGFDGFYIGDEKIESQNRFTYEVTEDVTIDAKTGIAWVIQVWLQVQGGEGSYEMFGGNYRLVEQEELPTTFPSLRGTDGEVGENIWVSNTYATTGVSIANEIGDGTYELDTVNSTESLSITLVADDNNTLLLVYSYAQPE